MILDAKQWQRLHSNVKQALPWLMKKGLFYGSIGVLQKIASSSLHELYQIRSENDWKKFTEGFPDPLPLRLVLNFANGMRTVTWPFPKGSTQLKEAREKFAEGLRTHDSRQLKWTISYDRLWSTSWLLDYDSEHFGGIVNVFIKTTSSFNYSGIMCADDRYIPCSVDF